MVLKSASLCAIIAAAALAQAPRAITIPQSDLSADSAIRTVVDREDGQYLGHPTTVLLEDGRTMITVYPKGHGRGGIVMKRSTDGGRTWSGRLPTPENWATSQETPTIHRVMDRDGTRRLILFSGLYPIRLAVSEDDGATWSPLAPIGDFGGIVAMSALVEHGPGVYGAYFHDDGRFIRPGGAGEKRFRVYRTLSRDGGLTWSAPIELFSHPDAHLCEPGIVRSPDDRRLAILLRENSRKFNSFIAFSDDEGATWTTPREMNAALTGDRHIGVYTRDGGLFLTFRDTAHESPTKGSWVAWLGHWDDLVQNRAGQRRFLLLKNHKASDCCYPGLERLPDGTLVTTTYGHWTPGQQPYIVTIHLPVKLLKP